MKGGARPDDPHAVDAISGGTITSDGLSHMLYDGLNAYLPYLQKRMNSLKTQNEETL